MCIICASKKGIRQPTAEEIKRMFQANPHGAGYMFARNGKVEIHKGFMRLEDYIKAIKREGFTNADPVVYHLRISTQAGITPTMTHPFPLSKSLEAMEALDITDCPVGVAHNGIIKMTSDRSDKRYNDTARFITSYLVKLVRNKADLADPAVMEIVETLTNSRWAFLDRRGDIYTAGSFIDDDGLMFSNSTYKPITARFATTWQPTPAIRRELFEGI